MGFVFSFFLKKLVSLVLGVCCILLLLLPWYVQKPLRSPGPTFLLPGAIQHLISPRLSPRGFFGSQTLLLYFSFPEGGACVTSFYFIYSPLVVWPSLVLFSVDQVDKFKWSHGS